MVMIKFTGFYRTWIVKISKGKLEWSDGSHDLNPINY